MILLLAATLAAASPEWGQWAGPNRNFTVPARSIASQWPEAGPQVLWKRPMPFGSSSMVVDGRRLYTMYRDVDNEVVMALDAGSGKTVWEYKYPAAFLTGMNMKTGPGPHATPLVVGNRLYTAGVTGKLHCLDKRSGKVLWMRGLIEEMGGNVMLRGYSNSPLLYKGSLIVMLGGKGRTIAALDPKSGKLRWQGGDFNNSHSSPVIINVNGQDQIAVVVEKAVAGFDPANGRTLWSHPHENRGGDITTTLIWGPDNLLFFSGAYQGGSRTLQLSQAGGRTEVKELWFHRQMRVHHSNVMRIGGYVYASNGDFGSTIYMCVDIRTGEIKWRDRAIVRANTLLVGDQPLVLDEEGVLYLVSLSPEGLVVKSKFQVLENLAWTPPSIAGTRLYLRDRKSMVALDLK
ncbi:MAG: PQQ-binding-like beta-propeller repeat protein [Bryobacteraceae bacterium]|nr:PQQ-binding-like beta-propeller repeat protein [Bryobacteraceae bacterium]